MFAPEKFDWELLDVVCDEFVNKIIDLAIDCYREPTEFMFGDHVVDPDGYNDAVLEEQEKMWDCKFKIPVEESMILLDRVNYRVFRGCCYDKTLPKFETLEVLFDSRSWGEEISLNLLGDKYLYPDGTKFDPKEDCGDYETLEESLKKHIKLDCCKTIGEYLARVDGGRTSSPDSDVAK